MKNLNDPFNPNGGEFAKNIREEGDLSELRESMATYGWVREFPALSDERGVILVGHRRLAVAKELNLEPVIKELTLGDGDEADAKRLQLAIVSNIGFKPMGPGDRKRIAEYLYGEREWTMQRIAEALGVNQATITRDLDSLCTTHKPARPNGGRPKGSGKTAKPPRKNETPAAERAASLVLDEGKTYSEAEAATGFSNTVLRQAVAREEGRREAAGTVDPATLSMPAQQKLEAAIRQATKRLEVEIEQRIHAEKIKWIEGLLKTQADERAHYQQVIKARRGVMTRADYKKVLACLHPDRVTDPALKARYEEAFILMTDLEKCLLNEKESPTEFPPMPRTVEELLARKEQVKAERRAKREQGTTVH